jgi:hypothetical protein
MCERRVRGTAGIGERASWLQMLWLARRRLFGCIVGASVPSVLVPNNNGGCECCFCGERRTMYCLSSLEAYRLSFVGYTDAIQAVV